MSFNQEEFKDNYLLGQLPFVKEMIQGKWYQQFAKKILDAHNISRQQLERVTYHNVSSSDLIKFT